MRTWQKTALRSLLVISVLALSAVVAAIGLEFSMLLDRAVLAKLIETGTKFLPTLFLHPLHILVMFAALLLITVPTALTIGFALRSRIRLAIPWAFSIAVLLLAIFEWFLPVQSSSQSLSRWSIVFSLMLIVGGAIVGLLTGKKSLVLITASALAAMALLVPSVTAFATATKGPPDAQKVWTAVLQKQTWQGMNTGSDYGATRQLVFAGDRIVAVFDAGLTGYENSNVGGSTGKWSLSSYRFVSLDAATGEKKNELAITGRWGSMPYIYARDDGRVDVQGNPPRTLNADLSTDTSLTSVTPVGTTQKELTIFLN